VKNSKIRDKNLSNQTQQPIQNQQTDSKTNVYISNTIKPINIENLVVERAVRRVRRYSVEVEGGVDGERRFYCALRDCHVPVESLPVSDCHGCPNMSCRGRVLERGVEVE
jgi:hypothetical protein